MIRCILLLALALPSVPLPADAVGDGERRLLRTLRARGEVIRERLRMAYAPFLRECEVHLGRADLSPQGRADLEEITLDTLDAWIERGREGDLPALVRLHVSIFDELAPGEARRGTLLRVARLAAGGKLPDEDLSLLTDLLSTVEGPDAEGVLLELKGPGEPEPPPPVQPPPPPTPLDLVERDEWIAAYRAVDALPEGKEAWAGLRSILAGRDGWAPLRILLGAKGDWPALDDYCQRWPDRVQEVPSEAQPRIRVGTETAPFPGRTPDGSWEILLPQDLLVEVEVLLPDGDVLRVPCPPSGSGGTIRVPHRIPSGMVFIPREGETGTAFFVDRTECPGDRVAEFLRTRPEELAWLAKEVGRALEIPGPNLPVLLRRDLPSVDAWKAATEFAAFWERKSIPALEEWQAVRGLWSRGGVLLRANLDRESPALEEVSSPRPPGPCGISHLIGNAWEILEGREVVGGGTEPLPWNIGRDPRRLLGRTFSWDDDTIRNVGFRMVIRLHPGEEDGP